MAGLDREALIGGLAAEFDKAKGLDVNIDKSNFIEPSNSLNCSAMGLPMDSLQKTKNVAQSYLAAFKAEAAKDRLAASKMMYMEIAIKCIDEIIAMKMKN